jgi:16S rRNA (cytidine1402-2'-O)-methyltransferase
MRKKIQEQKENIPAFFVIGTPIGNMGDFSPRGVKALQDADYILAEDTRVTQKLALHYGLKKKIIRCDEYAGEKLFMNVGEDIRAGKSVAFVSDAGTPGIADPAAKIVSFLSHVFPEIPIVPIPGASAVSTILSVCGIHANQFVFLGFPPHKKGREKFFSDAAALPIRPLVLFESPHRVGKTFQSIAKYCGGETPLVVGRELTKLHEEIFRGTADEAVKHWENGAKGEFVIIVNA